MSRRWAVRWLSPCARAVLVGVGLSLALAPAAPAQLADNPVFFDDSTVAEEGLRQAPRLIAAGNTSEAVRLLQRLLDTESERLHTIDGERYAPVRERVHALLLDTPGLLERYREAYDARADDLVRAGGHEEAERSMLLTRAGFEACLRVAQEHLEAARFGAAVRTLAQLDDHPDRARVDQGGQAARLAALIATFSASETAIELASRWAREAGIPEPGAVPPPPEPGREGAVLGPLRESNAYTEVSLDGVVPEALRSVLLTPTGAPSPVNERRRSSQGSVSWALPSATEDTVYVNDGATVSALDRFTLRPIWRMRTEQTAGTANADRRRRLGRLLEDPCTVTIAGERIVATTGLAAANRAARDGDGRVHAIERATGRLLWSTDVAEEHDDLTRSSVRGPAIVVGDTVVVAVRKTVTTRRLVSLFMVGLDLETGALRWHRLLATAGSLPFSQYSRVMEASVERDGVIYRLDEMGIGGAYEAHSGRPLWVRRYAVGDSFASDPVNAWNIAPPLIDGDSMITVSPSGLDLIRVSLEDGSVLGARPVTQVTGRASAVPRYLVRVGESLAAVGDTSVSFLPLDAFETADPRQAPILSAPAVRGRAASVAGRLHLPFDTGEERGLMIIDPENPRSPRTVALESVGNTLVLPGQVIMVDESTAHSYLSWDLASRHLLDRMRSDPSDPAPAAALAELAYRSGRHESIAGAVDHAARALDAAPDETARARLHDVVARMVAISVGEDAGLEALGPPIQEGPVVADLLERLAALARTSEERVVQRMLAGRFEARASRFDRALEAYQGILASPDLAQVSWRAGRVSIRADLEATRRVESIVRAQGAAAYGSFSRDAAARVGEVPAGDERALVALASAYPYAGVTPSVWLRVGDARQQTDRPFAALRAWRSGLTAAMVIADAEGSVATETVGELLGRIAGALAAQGRRAEVGPIIDSARVAFGPGLVVLEGGAPVNVEDLIAGARSADPSARAHPRLGTRPAIDAAPTILPGSVLEPVRSRGAGAHTRTLLLSAQQRELRRITVDDAGSPSTRWSRALGSAVVPLVLDDDDERVVIAWAAGPEAPARLEALDQETGETVWNSGPLRDALTAWPAPPEFGVGSRMIVPGASDVTLSEFVAALGRRVACMVERTGRVAAVDLSDGTIAWADQLEVRRVADALVTGGVLVVGGVDDPGPQGARRADLRADLREDRELGPVGLVVGYDARTGQRLQRIEGLGGRVRWLRAADAGDVIVGTDRALASVNLVEGRVNWMIDDGPAQASLDAWSFGRRMLVLGSDRAVYVLDTATGRLAIEPVMTDGRVSGLDAIRFHGFGERAALAGVRGVVVVDGRGDVRGTDALGADGLLPAAAAEGLLVTVEPKPLRRPGQPDHEIHMLTAESAKIVATAPIRVPEGVAVGASAVSAIDGHVLIGFGDATLVVRAPVDGE